MILGQVIHLTETKRDYVTCPWLPITKQKVTNYIQGKKNPKKTVLFIKKYMGREIDLVGMAHLFHLLYFLLKFSCHFAI